MQIVVKTGNVCNFACVYCSEGDADPMVLEEETFHQLVDGLPELLERQQDKAVTILWHGGEPLLWGLERLDRAMDYAEKQLENYALSFTMQTNGYLIDDAAMAVLQHHAVQVGVSLDGYPDMQDRNRPTKDGQSTFVVVWQNIQRLRQAHLGGGILMVLNTAEAIDVDRLYQFIEENQLYCKINPLIPCGRAADCPDAGAIYRNYVQLLEQLYEKAVSSQKKIILDPLDKLMDAILWERSPGECTYSGTCSQDILCLYADGQIGFCGRDSATEKFAYGCLQDASLLELYDSGTAQRVRARDAYLAQHDCRNCDVWDLCHGGCTFEALNAVGTLEAAFPFCQERRELLHYLQTTGLVLLKERLIREKRQLRFQRDRKKKFLKEVAQDA